MPHGYGVPGPPMEAPSPEMENSQAQSNWQRSELEAILNRLDLLTQHLMGVEALQRQQLGMTEVEYSRAQQEATTPPPPPPPVTHEDLNHLKADVQNMLGQLVQMMQSAVATSNATGVAQFPAAEVSPSEVPQE